MGGGTHAEDDEREVARQRANAILRARVALGEITDGTWTSDHGERAHLNILSCLACGRKINTTWCFWRTRRRDRESRILAFIEFFHRGERDLAREHRAGEIGEPCLGLVRLEWAPSGEVIDVSELEMLAGE